MSPSRFQLSQFNFINSFNNSIKLWIYLSSFCCYKVADKRAKTMSAFVSKNMIFPYIHLYRFIFPQEIRAPFGHQNIKKYCSFNCPDKKNFSIFNSFQGLMILNKPNSNTIFYSISHSARKSKAPFSGKRSSTFSFGASSTVFAETHCVWWQKNKAPESLVFQNGGQMIHPLIFSYCSGR